MELTIMKTKSFLLVCASLFFLPHLKGQQYATFSTDSAFAHRWYSEEKGGYDPQISEQVWIIRGKELRYGSQALKVELIPGKTDTILFKAYRRPHFDTIICFINEAKHFQFQYNPCCGAFNVKEQGQRGFFRASIIYRLKGESSKSYLGTLGETGILLKSGEADTLKPFCRSAMSPNVYPISFREIEICRSANCEEGTCLQGEAEPELNFSYTTISSKLNCLFMPLSAEALVVTYDPISDKIELKTH